MNRIHLYKKPLLKVSKKMLLFGEGLSENVKVEADEVLKIKESAIANECFQPKSNAEIGIFWQTLNSL